jgi:hypothetical protein
VPRDATKVGPRYRDRIEAGGCQPRGRSDSGLVRPTRRSEMEPEPIFRIPRLLEPLI